MSFIKDSFGFAEDTTRSTLGGAQSLLTAAKCDEGYSTCSDASTITVHFTIDSEKLPNTDDKGATKCYALMDIIDDPDTLKETNISDLFSFANISNINDDHMKKPSIYVLRDLELSLDESNESTQKFQNLGVCPLVYGLGEKFSLTHFQATNSEWMKYICMKPSGLFTSSGKYVVVSSGENVTLVNQNTNIFNKPAEYQLREGCLKAPIKNTYAHIACIMPDILSGAKEHCVLVSAPDGVKQERTIHIPAGTTAAEWFDQNGGEGVVIVPLKKFKETLGDLITLRATSRVWSPETAGFEIYFPKGSVDHTSPLKGTITWKGYRCIPCNALDPKAELCNLTFFHWEKPKINDEDSDSDDSDC